MTRNGRKMAKLIYCDFRFKAEFKSTYVDVPIKTSILYPELQRDNPTDISWWLEVNCPATSSFYLEEAAFSLSAHAKGVDHLNWA